MFDKYIYFHKIHLFVELLVNTLFAFKDYYKIIYLYIYVCVIFLTLILTND